MPAIRLIAGLGNPGPQYQDTRHNVGADFVVALAERYRIPLAEEARFKGLFKIVGLIMIPFAKKSSKKHLDESFGKWKSLAEGGDGEPDEN